MSFKKIRYFPASFTKINIWTTVIATLRETKKGLLITRIPKSEKKNSFSLITIRLQSRKHEIDHSGHFSGVRKKFPTLLKMNIKYQNIYLENHPEFV